MLILDEIKLLYFLSNNLFKIYIKTYIFNVFINYF